MRHLSKLDSVIGFGLVLVLRSEKEGIKAGDYMYGQTPWEAYTVQPYIEGNHSSFSEVTERRLIIPSHLGRINFKPEDWPPATFDMDSLALQVVPNPGGAFPITHYASALGTPGLSAFVGFEGLAQAKEVCKWLRRYFVNSEARFRGKQYSSLLEARGSEGNANPSSSRRRTN